jgi:hypothetical protein
MRRSISREILHEPNHATGRMGELLCDRGIVGRCLDRTAVRGNGSGCRSSEQQQKQAGDAFATPTIVHFGTVLLLSAVLSAPWTDIGSPVLIVTAIGISGFFYSMLVTRRMRRQTAYQPVFEDWLFHALLPLTAYGILAASGYEAYFHSHGSIFGMGAAALALLFTGIHNAWDAASYHVFVARRRQSSNENA